MQGPGETKGSDAERSVLGMVLRDRTLGKHFYFVKVTQKDGNMLWSAPVWVTVE